MGNNLPEKENLPPEMLASWGAVFRYGASKLIQAVFREKPYKYLILLLGMFFSAHLVFIYMLPVEERAAAKSPLIEMANTIGVFLRSSWIQWLGWVLFVFSLLFFVPVTGILWKRIQNQGELLKNERDKNDSMRVSSRSPETIEQYDDQMKNKYGEQS